MILDEKIEGILDYYTDVCQSYAAAEHLAARNFHEHSDHFLLTSVVPLSPTEETEFDAVLYVDGPKLESEADVKKALLVDRSISYGGQLYLQLHHGAQEDGLSDHEPAALEEPLKVQQRPEHFDSLTFEEGHEIVFGSSDETAYELLPEEAHAELLATLGDVEDQMFGKLRNDSDVEMLIAKHEPAIADVCASFTVDDVIDVPLPVDREERKLAIAELYSHGSNVMAMWVNFMRFDRNAPQTSLTAEQRQDEARLLSAARDTVLQLAADFYGEHRVQSYPSMIISKLMGAILAMEAFHLVDDETKDRFGYYLGDLLGNKRSLAKAHLDTPDIRPQ